MTTLAARMPGRVAQSYRRVATETASPGQRVLMMYEGALKFLERARCGFDFDDPLESNLAIHNNIGRARAILHELDAALDVNGGGELAVTLRRLYEYFDWRLDESLRHKRIEGLDEVMRRLNTLRDAWEQMLQRNEDGAVAREA